MVRFVEYPLSDEQVNITTIIDDNNNNNKNCRHTCRRNHHGGAGTKNDNHNSTISTPSSSSSSPPTTTKVVNIADIEREAKRRLPRYALDYYQSGAGDELTLEDNRTAYNRIRIIPRVMRDMSCRDTSTTLLSGSITVRCPILVSPTAMQRMATPMGEIANALACEREGTVMTLSTISTTSLEEVAHAAPKLVKFFQLYIYKNRELTRKLVQRAEAAQYRALVLTVDTPFFGQRYADERNCFRLPSHLRMANFDQSSAESNRVQSVTGSANTGSSGLAEYANSLFDPSITWKDVKWLQSITRLPIIAKGVLCGADAELAIQHGCAAIIVSNHGGRQLDTVPSTIDVLEEVVAAVAGRCEVYLDGGIRRGTDVFKAIALGAKAVFIGRPMVYGLAYNGVAGAQLVLRMLRREFEQTMGLAGCARVTDITRSMVLTPGDLYRKQQQQARQCLMSKL